MVIGNPSLFSFILLSKKSSLGSAISYELAKHMIDKKKKDTNLELLVEMGRGPPHLTDPDRPYSQMTDKEIIAELKSMAGNLIID